MTFDLHKLPDESITILTLHADYNVKTDMAVSTPKILELIKTQTEPVIHIVDTTAAHFSFEDLLVGANRLARGGESLYHNTLIREVVYVAPSEIVKAVTQGMNSDAFGHVSIALYDTLDGALAYARTRLQE